MMFLLIVTLSSMVLAAIMSLVAWRMAAEERRRSEARVAALAEEIHAPIAAASAVQPQAAYREDAGMRAEPARLASFASARRAPRWDDAIHDLPLRPERSASPDLFTTVQPSGTGSRFAAGAAVAAVVAAAAIAAFAAAGRRSTPAAPSTTATAARDNRSAVAAAQPSPLELAALGHQRDGDRLTVRGVVRNPASGAAFTGLTASVFVFDADGGFVASGRSPIDERVLNPSGESTFLVELPNATAVSRYRVSFRFGDRIVAHVDKRDLVKR